MLYCLGKGQELLSALGVNHITNSRLTVGRQVAYISSKTCWPSVGQLSADKRPTVGQLSADRQPTVGRLWANCRPTVDRQLANRFFGELFFTIIC